MKLFFAYGIMTFMLLELIHTSEWKEHTVKCKLASQRYAITKKRLTYKLKMLFNDNCEGNSKKSEGMCLQKGSGTYNLNATFEWKGNEQNHVDFEISQILLTAIHNTMPHTSIYSCRKKDRPLIECKSHNTEFCDENRIDGKEHICFTYEDTFTTLRRGGAMKMSLIFQTGDDLYCDIFVKINDD